MVGYGEATSPEGPFYNHESTGTAWHILRDFLIPRVLQASIQSPGDAAAILKPIRGHGMAKAAVESALWDLHARQAGKPLHQLLGGNRRSIDCGVSIGIQDTVGELLKKIEKEVAAGYQRIKIKIKPGWDLEVVREVRNDFPSILLMCDANSAYTLRDIDLFKKMDEFKLLMIEQPLWGDDLYYHVRLQKKLKTDICLDESIRSARDACAAVETGACRIINIKVGRVGGFSEARKIHDICHSNGIPVWCGGMLESGIGRAHNIALSTLPNFRLPGDVSASKRYWKEDIVEPQVTVSSGGTIPISNDAGTGYSVREDLIEKLTVRKETLEARQV
jgi:O-succinylbenzoate synthase